MAPQDATMYWLSARTRNDLFLLYCFADRGLPIEELRASVAERSARIADLRVRLRELPGDIDYPIWTRSEFAVEQIVEHELPERNWSNLLEALGELLGTGVDAAVHPWRLHLFRSIADAPGLVGEPALVAVLQMSHALADGRRASVIARALFGGAGNLSDEHESRTGGSGPGGGPAGDSATDAAGAERSGGRARCAYQSVPEMSAQEEFADPRGGGWTAIARERTEADSVSASGSSVRVRVGSTVVRVRTLRDAMGRSALPASVLVDSAVGLLRVPARLAATAVRGYQVFRAQQRLAALTEGGELPPPGPGFPPTVLNRTAAEGISRHEARMLVFPAGELRVPGRTVTVVVLTAVSVALARYLADRGEPVERLGAQVPMALAEATGPRNNYRSLGVDLFVDEPDLRLRTDKIAAALAERRVRARHPLLSAQDRVTATIPAFMLRRDVDRYPLDTVPGSIAGHTVVSSVDRGPADLSFGGGPVRFTAGFPSIGSVMHLTHGVHGLGDTVTVSLHADPAVLPDLDAYAGHLRAALLEAHRTGVGSAPA
ncbi:WS/DGAT domain-containing protein [Nocardia beijingensis]|uniref:WS/DGAT domain-containing protein n=1 Tax=Nocardia beijingensis TaxID=95162 RepID=UPI001E33D805|nr:WS/DGAT domain-containing protein [Nocardia beijingensis]